MFIALVITTALLAVICVQSAATRLRRNGQVLAVIHGTVGVPQRHLPVLAALELAGAVGLLAGLWLEPLGVARDRPRHLLRQRARRPRARGRHQETSRCRCRRSCSPSPCSSSAS